MNRHLAWIHLAESLPVPLAGRTLHRAGLEALAQGHPSEADRLFECAGLALRRELDVERLARLRVHQLIARYHAGVRTDGRDELALSIERQLYRLPRIESLVPPFALVDARELLASWTPVAEREDAAAA